MRGKNNIYKTFSKFRAQDRKKLEGVRKLPKKPGQKAPAPVPPKPPKPAPTPNISTVKYILNDFTTPNLMKVVVPPNKPGPDFTVKDYVGKDGTKTQWVATNTYCTMCYTLTNLSKFKPITRWVGTPSLKVLPMAGSDLNAYYDRKNIKVFYYKDPKTKQTLYLGDSADVVSHELGHAILDSYRPELFNMVAMEVWAFHEAFGDIIAILSSLQHEEVIAFVLEQTNNNLKQSNVVSRIGEHLGQVIYGLDPNGRSPDSLRDANNEFVYVNPRNLPDDAPDNQISAEPHSFSRIMSGAMYSILANIAKKTNLQTARDVVFKYLVEAVAITPVSVNFYNNFASTMLLIDKNHGGTHENIVRAEFEKRGILRPLKLLSATNLGKNLGKISGQVKEFSGGKIVSNRKITSFKLCDKLGITAQSDNPLYYVGLRVPKDSHYIFDTKNRLEDEINPSEDEIVADSKRCVNFLHTKKEVSSDEKTMFEIKNDSLERTHFRCPCRRCI